MTIGTLNLIIKTIDAPSVPGGRALALCSEDGEIVGKQISCAVANEVDAIGIITVQFHIDGQTIRFASNDG